MRRNPIRTETIRLVVVGTREAYDLQQCKELAKSGESEYNWYNMPYTFEDPG